MDDEGWIKPNGGFVEDPEIGKLKDMGFVVSTKSLENFVSSASNVNININNIKIFSDEEISKLADEINRKLDELCAKRGFYCRR